MTVPMDLTDRLPPRDAQGRDDRPLKRVKLAPHAVPEPDTSGNAGVMFVRRHPLGLRPSGNAYTAEKNAKDAAGILACLPDEIIAQICESLQARDLLSLGGTCRALHAFTRNEELWKAFVVESSSQMRAWKGTWRSTYLSQASEREPIVDCSDLYSDLLHRPFFCAYVNLQKYTENIPEQNEIPRLPDLSYEDFSKSWVNRPFILTEPVRQWPVYKTWSTSNLVQKFADVTFRAEAVDWPLRNYLDYLNNSRDESPLYLFDRGFAEKMELNVTDAPDPSAAYWPPTCFGSDAFSVLGAQRPDHRWLIIGPDRSGSTFHKDPNATSAWNAIIKGRKYWIMFPSSASIPPPPGVYVSEDQSEVTSPLSIAEWLLGFHAEARVTPGCQEGICEEGEVFYVPSGWYHLVLNLEASIAITQNFVPKSRVGAVLHFLRDQKQSISGFCDEVEDPYSLFVERLRASDPDALAEGLRELDRISKAGKGKWEELTKPTDVGEQDGGDGGGFSFGFGGNDDDDDVEIP